MISKQQKSIEKNLNLNLSLKNRLIHKIKISNKTLRTFKIIVLNYEFFLTTDINYSLEIFINEKAWDLLEAS